MAEEKNKPLLDRVMLKMGFCRRRSSSRRRPKQMSPRDIVLDRFNLISDELDDQLFHMKEAMERANYLADTCDKLSAEQTMLKEWLDAN